MGSVWVQLGVGGIFALLVIREVLNFLSRKSNPNNSILTEIRKTQQEILHAVNRLETLIRERLPRA